MIPTALIAAPDDLAAFPESVEGYFWPRETPGRLWLLTTVKALAERLHRTPLGLGIAHLLEAPSKSGNPLEDSCFSSLAQRGYS
jgi:hypothetical protein